MRTGQVLPLVLILLASMAHAGTFELEAAGVSVWLPDSWNVDIADDRLAAVSVDGNAALELAILKNAGNLETAEEASRARLTQAYRQWRDTETRRDATLGGMSGFVFGGEGVEAGVRRSVRAVVFKAPRRYVMLAWSAERSRASQNKPAYDRILASVKALRR